VRRDGWRRDGLIDASPARRNCDLHDAPARRDRCPAAPVRDRTPRWSPCARHVGPSHQIPPSWWRSRPRGRRSPRGDRARRPAGARRSTSGGCRRRRACAGAARHRGRPPRAARGRYCSMDRPSGPAPKRGGAYGTRGASSWRGGTSSHWRYPEEMVRLGVEPCAAVAHAGARVDPFRRRGAFSSHPCEDSVDHGALVVHARRSISAWWREHAP
jgi:hypothetical protein